MIKKFVGITNVGRFSSYGAAGDVQLTKLTVIFGENGKGKSTLTSIIRSVQAGDANQITARTSLPTTGAPEVKLLHDGGTTEFKSGAWSVPLPDIEVFDAHFVDDNVCSGLNIEHEHKRNLYRVIVGVEGVTLSRHVDDLDANIRTVNSEINDKKGKIKSYIVDGLDTEKFVALAKSDAIDELIAKKEEDIKTIKSAAEIAAKQSFAEIRIAAVPSIAILTKTLNELSKEAAEAVAVHTKTLDKNGEQWIEQGVGYLKGTCPFCTQSIKDLDLVSAYQAYFSKAYKELKSDIGQQLKAADDNYGLTQLLDLQNTFNGNTALTEFWKQFVEVILSPLDLADIVQSFKGIHGKLKNRIETKSASPLDSVEPGPELEAAIATYKELVTKVAAYNAACRTMNEGLKTVKARATGGNVSTAQKDLSSLKNTKKRHDPAVDGLCNEFAILQLKKVDLDGKKVKAKDALDTYSSTIFGRYEMTMNEHLTLFGADFRLANTSGNYQGGKPNSNYSIAINDCPVSVDAEDGKPSFKSTLSGGDKSCLALAFFLARLDHDLRLKDKVIVLDDPMCSMDRDRSDRTVKTIVELAKRAKQVIVLSHDPRFLRRIWDDTNPVDRKALCVRRVREAESTMEEWEIINATRSEYLQDYFALTKFLQEATGDLRDLARKIRPLLEENLRMRYPDIFVSGQWLGNFLDTIRNSNPGDVAQSMKPHLTELDDLNDFSKKYHHSNPGSPREPITDGALRIYATRTVTFLRGNP